MLLRLLQFEAKTELIGRSVAAEISVMGRIGSEITPQGRVCLCVLI
jgi:hypothetical protein